MSIETLSLDRTQSGSSAGSIPSPQLTLTTRSSPSQSVLSQYSPYQGQQGSSSFRESLRSNYDDDSETSSRENTDEFNGKADSNGYYMQGWLRKKSPKGMKGAKPWQNRYFVLAESDIRYYASDEVFKKSPSSPKGVIKIATIEALALASDNRIHIGVQKAYRKGNFRTFYLKVSPSPRRHCPDPCTITAALAC